MPTVLLRLTLTTPLGVSPQAAAASAAGATAAAAATHVDGVEVRPNKRKLFRASLLDTGRGVSAKVARLKQSGEDEALAAVAAENEYEHKRRKEDLKTVRGCPLAAHRPCTNRAVPVLVLEWVAHAVVAQPSTRTCVTFAGGGARCDPPCAP